MTLKIFEQPAAYMVHDLGPRRYHDLPRCMTSWSRSKLGQLLLAIMAPFGLDQRDAYLGDARDLTYVAGDTGRISIDNRDFVAQRAELDAMFASIAAGVAQERMMRLAGWRPGKALPLWAVTASDALVALADRERLSLTELWNEEDSVGFDSYVSFFETGMQLSLYDDDLYYKEDCEGATLTLSSADLANDGTDRLVGQRLGDVCTRACASLRVLAGYRITDATGIPPSENACSPEPHRTLLRLAVPMRTLEPVPADVLTRAGVDVPVGVALDHPLWMLTPPELLRRYRPRLA